LAIATQRKKAAARFDRRLSIAVLSSSRLLGGFRLGLPCSLGGLDDVAIADRLGRNVDPDNSAVYDRPDPLNIGLEGAIGLAGGLDADAAESLRFAAAGILSAGCRFLSGKWALAWHF